MARLDARGKQTKRVCYRNVCSCSSYPVDRSGNINLEWKRRGTSKPLLLFLTKNDAFRCASRCVWTAESAKRSNRVLWQTNGTGINYFFSLRSRVHRDDPGGFVNAFHLGGKNDIPGHVQDDVSVRDTHKFSPLIFTTFPLYAARTDRNAARIEILKTFYHYCFLSTTYEFKEFNAYTDGKTFRPRSLL